MAWVRWRDGRRHEHPILQETFSYGLGMVGPPGYGLLQRGHGLASVGLAGGNRVSKVSIGQLRNQAGACWSMISFFRCNPVPHAVVTKASLSASKDAFSTGAC